MEILKAKNFKIWGLSFKPNTDDMREAPSITIINQLLENGVSVPAFDSVAINSAKNYFGDRIRCTTEMYESSEIYDALLILTEWNEFRKPASTLLKAFLKEPIVFDGRNIYSMDKMENEGITYVSIERSIVNHIMPNVQEDIYSKIPA